MHANTRLCPVGRGQDCNRTSYSLGRTLPGLLLRAYSQVNDYPGCARVTASMPWSPDVARSIAVRASIHRSVGDADTQAALHG